MNNKKSFHWQHFLGWVGVIAIIGVVGTSLYRNKFPSRAATSVAPIQLGMIGHFSGEYASYGVPMLQAAELAIKKINDDGGINGRPLQLVTEDDVSNATTAATAMNKLIHIDNLNYILSAESSGVASVVAPLAENNGRLLMITLGSSPGLTDVGKYIFRTVPSDAYQAVEMNNLIDNTIKSKKVAGLYLNDAYGRGIQKIIDQDSNVPHVDNEFFNENDTDVRTQLTKIKASGADTLVVVAHSEYPYILKQIKELQVPVTIITSETFKDEKMLSDSGAAAEGIYVSFMPPQVDYAGFSQAFQATYAEAPSAYSMYAYDGVVALAKALGEAKDAANVEQVRNALLGIRLNGASGQVGFSSDGDRAGSIYTAYLVKNGHFQEVK